MFSRLIDTIVVGYLRIKYSFTLFLRIKYSNTFLNLIKNAWIFRKELRAFKKYDYEYNFDLFTKSLELTSEHIRKNGYASNKIETADEIQRFCDLYYELRENSYMEKAGCDFDKIEYTFKDIGDGTGSSELITTFKEPYNEKLYWEHVKKSQKLKKKDFDEFCEIFKNFKQWWD